MAVEKEHVGTWESKTLGESFQTSPKMVGTVSAQTGKNFKDMGIWSTINVD